MKRLAYIDGLRAIAALMVLATHAWVFSGAPALSFHVGAATIVLGSIPAIGNIGVNLFLVLSGFCLTWPFLNDPTYRDRTSISKFWVRRVQRIVPAYYASIVVVIGILVSEQVLYSKGIWPQRGPAGATPGDLWQHLFFVHNFSVEHVSSINGSYWSLALEFQLYLLFPLFYEMLRRWGAVPLLIAVLCMQLAVRMGLAAALTPDVVNLYDFVLPKSVFGRAFDFVSGMAAATYVARFARCGYPTGARRNAIIVCAIVPLATAFALFYAGNRLAIIRDVLWAVGFGSLICWGAMSDTFINRILSVRLLVGLGVMSYSLYLLHQPLMEATCAWIRVLLRPGAAFFASLAAGGVIIAVAAAFYWCCERNALRYFARRRTTGAKVETPSNLPQLKPVGAAV
jgi:peptidoglycan/LPS O-acetylase OafA/YrhL